MKSCFMLNTSSTQAASEYEGKACTFKSDIQELWDQRSTQIRYAPLLFLEWESLRQKELNSIIIDLGKPCKNDN